MLADTLRLARLAEDLLVLARLDEQARPAAPGKPVDLAALAAEEAARARGRPGAGDGAGRRAVHGHR